MLNGKRMLIRGNALRGFPFRESALTLWRAANLNADRAWGAYGPNIKNLDVTDEFGWLVDVGLGHNYPDDPRKMDLFKKSIRGFIRCVGNHPSVVGWVWISQQGYEPGPHGHPMVLSATVDPETQKTHLAFRANRMLAELDAGFHLDGYTIHGLGGNTQQIMISLSYGIPVQEMEEWLSAWAKTKPCAILLNEQQIFSRPDFFWQRGSKESVVCEHYARFFGEKAYQKINKEFVDRWQDIGFRFWSTSEYWFDMYKLGYTRALRAWRTYGISGYLFHATWKMGDLYTRDANRKMVLKPWGKIVRDLNEGCIMYIGGPKDDWVSKDHACWPGQMVSKTAIIVNDTMGDLKGKVAWKVATEKGNVLVEKTVPVTTKQGTRSFEPISFKAPEVKEKTGLTVTAEYTSDDGTIKRIDTFAVQVFPVPEKVTIRKPVALIDSTGETAEVLKKMGVPYKLFDIKAILAGARTFNNYSLLIIGSNSYPEAVKAFTDHLPFKNPVKEGLNVVVLSQANRNVAGLTVENFKTHRAFILDNASPLLAGLADEDFIEWRGESTFLPPYRSWNTKTPVDPEMLHGEKNSFGQRRFWHWSNKGMVATFCYQKPQLGNYRILMENGFDVLFTPLVEYFEGKGKVLFCQLDLVDHYGTDPVATLLMHRILEQYVRPSDVTPRTIGYLGSDGGKAMLTQLNVAFDSGLARKKVAYISLSETADKALIERFVKGGGTILVSIDDQSAADLLPVKVTVEERDYVKGEVPADPIFAGISMSDLYYRKVLEYVPQVTSIDGKPAANGTLGVIPCGKGRIVYFQILPNQFEDPWQATKVLRVYSTLLTNIGGRSRAVPNFYLIGGYGIPNEWLPGFGTEVEDLEARPMVEKSPLYWKPALDFDCNQSYVW